MNRLALLAALLLFALFGGRATALNEKNQGRPGQPVRINAAEDELIRERERMRREYREMREKRLAALKETEERTTGRSSAAVPGWRTGRDGNPSGAGAVPPGEMPPDELMPGQATLVNTFLIVCGAGLCVLLFFRLRRGAAMRKRRKRFKKPDGPMSVSLKSIDDRRYGGQSGGYPGRMGVAADHRSSQEVPRAS